MRGGDPAALRVSAVCLKVLLAPAATREAITHASSSLISLAIASWRSDGFWPQDEPATIDNTAKPNTGHDSEDCYEHDAVGGFDCACSVLCAAFFPAGQEESSPPQRQQRNGRVSSGNSMTTLLASFMPLPPRATLAICRAIVHIVSPAILLASVVSTDIGGNSRESNRDGGACLLAGPVLRGILLWCGARSQLQLRFFALQVSVTASGLERKSKITCKFHAINLEYSTLFRV